MSIAAAVNQTLDRMAPGQIFGYEVFPQYREAPGAVVRAVNRSVESGRLRRVAKGRFLQAPQGCAWGTCLSVTRRVCRISYTATAGDADTSQGQHFTTAWGSRHRLRR